MTRPIARTFRGTRLLAAPHANRAGLSGEVARQVPPAVASSSSGRKASVAAVRARRSPGPRTPTSSASAAEKSGASGRSPRIRSQRANVATIQNTASRWSPAATSARLPSIATGRACALMSDAKGNRVGPTAAASSKTTASRSRWPTTTSASTSAHPSSPSIRA